jgi:hypothetical protein
MSSFFLSAAETVLDMIQENGASVEVKRTTQTGFDPVSQTATKDVQTESFPAVVFPPGREASFRINTLEHQKAQEVYFAILGKSFEPGPGDTFEWQGTPYTIFWSKTYNPDGSQPVLTIAYAE